MISKSTLSKLHNLGTHLHLSVKRRHVRTEPMYDEETHQQIGWYTRPADWYLAWGVRTAHGTSYYYDGLENEYGYETHKEALERKKVICKEVGLWSEQTSKWTLHIGTHRGTLMSRDTEQPKVMDSLEDCRVGAVLAKRQYRAVGCKMWFAYAVGPDGSRVDFGLSEGYI